jgi:hypothetical protein
MGLLQSLKQGIGCAGVRLFEAKQDCHTIPGLIWGEGERMLQFANLFYFDHPADTICLDDRQVRMLHALDLAAGSAAQAGFTWSNRLRAVERLGEAQRKSPATNAARTGEQVSMPRASLHDMFSQQSDRPFLSKHLPVHAIIVAKAGRIGKCNLKPSSGVDTPFSRS